MINRERTKCAEWSTGRGGNGDWTKGNESKNRTSGLGEKLGRRDCKMESRGAGDGENR